MIRVFVYVTGIALGQFSGGDTATLLMLAGHNHYEEFDGLHAHHNVKIQYNNPRAEYDVQAPLPPVIRVGLPCSGCTGIKPPPGIANLAELIPNATIEPDCLDASKFRASGTRCALESGELLMSAHVTVTGPWQVAGVLDCYGKYSEKRNRLPKVGFVHPHRAWQLKGKTEFELGNSMLFYADVEDVPEEELIDNLLQINGKAVDLTVIEGGVDDTCARLGGHGSPDRCVVVAIRNSAADSSYLGGGDPHFAALYTVLKDRPPLDDVWLPLALEGPACPKGGGCCRLEGCIAAYVP